MEQLRSSDYKLPLDSVLLDRDVSVCDGELRQGRLHGEHAVPRQRRLYGFGVRALRQQELTIVLSVHGLCVGLLFVFRVNLKYLKKYIINSWAPQYKAKIIFLLSFYNIVENKKISLNVSAQGSFGFGSQYQSAVDRIIK